MDFALQINKFSLLFFSFFTDDAPNVAHFLSLAKLGSFNSQVSDFQAYGSSLLLCVLHLSPSSPRSEDIEVHQIPKI
jgi:hypothetical protein